MSIYRISCVKYANNSPSTTIESRAIRLGYGAFAALDHFACPRRGLKCFLAFANVRSVCLIFSGTVELRSKLSTTQDAEIEKIKQQQD